MSHFALTPYRELYTPSKASGPEHWLNSYYRNFIKEWSIHVCDHLANAKKFGIYPVFYERLLADTPGEIRKIAEYVGLEVDDSGIENVVQKVSKKEMKKSAPHHIRKGQASGWRNILSEEQVNWIDQKAGSILELWLQLGRASWF